MSFDHVLVIDWETSGLIRDSDSQRAYDSGPQGIEIGAVVVDASDWTMVGDFTSRVMFEPGMFWDEAAEPIHGIRREDLMDAPSSTVVAERFDEFLNGWFDPAQPILMAGQNPAGDRWFTHQLFHLGHRRPRRFHTRMLDTFTLGFYVWGCTTGNELFDRVCGVIRQRHSAYEDATLSAAVLCEAFRLNSRSFEDSHVSD